MGAPLRAPAPSVGAPPRRLPPPVEAPNGRRLMPAWGERPAEAARKLWPSATEREITAAVEEWEDWQTEMRIDTDGDDGES